MKTGEHVIGSRISLLMITVVSAFFQSLCTPPVHAQWSGDLYINTPVAIARDDQEYPTIINNIDGGTIVVWNDQRVGFGQTYAQRFDAMGFPQWQMNGVVVVAGGNSATEINTSVASDGAGGCIVTWAERRSDVTLHDIYAQRINHLGIPLWEENGMLVSSKPMFEFNPKIVSDGTGGVIVVWYTEVANYDSNDIFAQRVDSLGNTLWNSNGIPICAADNIQWLPICASDESGGALVAWEDRRNGTSDIYTQRVSREGEVQWATNGIRVIAQSGPQGIITDAAGGAIIIWDPNATTIFGQRVAHDGTLLWGGGAGVLFTTQYSGSAQLASDGNGGALLVSSAWSYALNAQRVSSYGVRLWGSDGISVTELSSASSAKVVGDRRGGIFTAYVVPVGPFHSDVYVQRIDFSGQRLWGQEGTAASLAEGYKGDPAIMTDGGGGCIVAFPDERSGLDLDLFVQRLAGDGTPTHTPVQVVLDYPFDGALVYSDTIALSWFESSFAVDRYWLEGDADSLFSSPFIDSLLTDTTYILTPLHHNNTFWWKVRAHNQFGWGAFSEVRSFFVYQEIPAPPALLDPPNGDVGTSTTPTLSWNPSVGSENYSLQLSDTPDFSNLIVNEVGIDSSSYLVSDLQNNATYYWHVSATNDLGTSDWSEVWRFTTLATTVDNDEDIPTEFSLGQNYPNPFNPSTTIKYGLPERADVRIELFNLLGQSVAVLVDDDMDAGWHEVRMDGSEYSSGLYFYRLEAGAFVMTKKLLLVR